MLYNLHGYFLEYWHGLYALKYISFRAFGAWLTALALSLMFGVRFIRYLKSLQAEGQPIRELGPESHLQTKKGTPTMGGLLIICTWLFATCLWADLTNPYIWVLIGITIGYGAIGFVDDYVKLAKRTSGGMKSRHKFLAQMALAFLAVLVIQHYQSDELKSILTVPLFKDIAFNLGWFFVPFAMVVIVGSSNAVNLTDGLDGLAIGPTIISGFCLGLIAYLVGHHYFAAYLHLPHVVASGEITIFCAALIGAGLGFLWFNAPPARVFMGDTGSLAIGGALGAISIMVKHEITWAIIGAIFVLEAISVMLQVTYFKYSKGKRIFLMAPIHHHFEKKGWPEPRVVIRFWIMALIAAMVGLATLKLR